jgi:hypothetical protein
MQDAALGLERSNAAGSVTALLASSHGSDWMEQTMLSSVVTALLAPAVLRGCGSLPEFQSNRALLASSVPPGLR